MSPFLLLATSLPEPSDVEEVIDTDGLTGSDWARAGGIFVGGVYVGANHPESWVSEAVAWIAGLFG